MAKTRGNQLAAQAASQQFASTKRRREVSSATDLAEKRVKFTPSHGSDPSYGCCDPFQVLNYDIIFQIIPQLEPSDAQQLRRTSKLWKAVLEFHVGPQSLMRDFPHTRLPMNVESSDGLSVEEARFKYRMACNLEYRRAYYHSQSFRKGMATHSLDLHSVTDWHLNNHRLVHTDSSSIWIRNLRNSDSRPRKYRVDQSVLKEKSVLHVQITNEGDLLVVSRYLRRKGVSVLDQPYHTDYSVAKFLTHEATPKSNPSSKGNSDFCYLGRKATSIKYQFDLVGQAISKPAMGQKNFYFVQSNTFDPKTLDNDTDLSSQPRFVKIDLSSGSLVYSTPISATGWTALAPGNEHRIRMNDCDTSLSLFSNERAAIWTDRFKRVYIFSTATGDLLYSFYKPPRVTITVDPHVSGLWYTDFADWDPEISRSTFVPLEFNEPATRVAIGKIAGSQWFGDMGFGRLANSHYYNIHNLHEKPTALQIKYIDSETSRLNPKPKAVAKFHLTALEKTYHENPVFSHQLPSGFEPLFSGNDTRGDRARISLVDDSSIKRAIPITLPRRADRDLPRRSLEVMVSRQISEDNKRSMVQGYMVYWMPNSEHLLLIDFFPRW